MSALVELLSITYRDEGGDGGVPSGTISVYDGKSGQVIYRCNQKQTTSHEKTHPISGTNQNGSTAIELLLTGPNRTISADGCVAIEFDFHHDCDKRVLSNVAQILVDIYDDSEEYDVTMSKTLKTCICDESPSAEVTYALLSDAVEAIVEVTYDPPVCFFVHKIIAISDRGEVVLFESNNEENTSSKSLDGKAIIPLARSVLAVPLESCIKIKAHLCAGSNSKIVDDSMECKQDNLDREHALLLDGENGHLDVKITFSD